MIRLMFLHKWTDGYIIAVQMNTMKWTDGYIIAVQINTMKWTDGSCITLHAINK